MEISEQINLAIAGHSMWKRRLRTAIEIGKSGFKPEIVKQDDKCDFGKWLHSELSPEFRASPGFEKIARLHADFHIEAARILQLALGRDQAEARSAMESLGTYASLSARLTTSLMEWKVSFEKNNPAHKT